MPDQEETFHLDGSDVKVRDDHGRGLWGIVEVRIAPIRGIFFPQTRRRAAPWWRRRTRKLGQAGRAPRLHV
jgi:hypothetical protein